MTTYYDSLDNLFKAMEEDIVDVLGDEVYNVAVLTQSRKVKTEVYDAYKDSHESGTEPFVYERRGFSDGLADPKNNTASFYYGVNQVEMLIQNITKGKEQTDLYIAPLVEHGHKNGYGEYNYPFNRANTAHKFLQPRPFISETIRDLEASLRHIDAMKRGLKKKGYSIT